MNPWKANQKLQRFFSSFFWTVPIAQIAHHFSRHGIMPASPEFFIAESQPNFAGIPSQEGGASSPQRGPNWSSNLSGTSNLFQGIFSLFWSHFKLAEKAGRTLPSSMNCHRSGTSSRSLLLSAPGRT